MIIIATRKATLAGWFPALGQNRLLPLDKAAELSTIEIESIQLSRFKLGSEVVNPRRTRSANFIMSTQSPPKNISMAELARQLSLSVGTVSMALNGRSCVTQSTRQRVVAAATAAGYVPNRQAAALRRQKTRLIGLLIPTFSNPIYIERVASAQQVAYERGYEISFASSEWRPDQEALLCQHFLGLNVDALIIDGPLSKPQVESGNDAFKPFFNRKIPVLQIVHANRGVLSGATRLNVDIASGFCLAMEHLLSLQHRHIGFVGICPAPQWTHGAQREGIARAIDQSGHRVETEFIAPAAASMESAYQAITERLQQPGPFPTALQAIGDQVALGVLKALHDHGMRVPQDVSLVGFDNVQASAFYYPSLTTVSQTHLDLGRKAVKAVLDCIENNSEPQNEQLNLKLVVRDSTGPASVNREARS
ncbi:LacI family DNA-binding transcriptional regulator [Phycisphaerales bacterium AB-hyl4]|uniref:LacI family DNA-binding transcriptional regulator n=1 Tax=Natronomicrosphaera hydrolytica TaxID=3242702 RepID=A0ABV4U9N5_9BACT